MARRDERRGGSPLEDIDVGDALRFAQFADEQARMGGVHEDQVRAQRKNLALRQAEEQRTGISGFSNRCAEFASRLDDEIRIRATAMAEAFNAGRPVPSGVIGFSYSFKPKNPLMRKNALRNIRQTVKDLLKDAPSEPPAGLFEQLRGSLGMARIQAALDQYSQNHNTRLVAQFGQSNDNLWTYRVSINIAQGPAALPAASYGPENRGDQFHGRAAFSAPMASVFGRADTVEPFVSYSAPKTEAKAGDRVDALLDHISVDQRTELIGLAARVESAKDERFRANEGVEQAELGRVPREVSEARIRYGAASRAFDTAEAALNARLTELETQIGHRNERARIQESLSGTSFLHDPKARENGFNTFSFGEMEGVTDPFTVRVPDSETGGPANENRDQKPPHAHAAE